MRRDSRIKSFQLRAFRQGRINPAGGRGDEDRFFSTFNQWQHKNTINTAQLLNELHRMRVTGIFFVSLKFLLD